MREKQLSTFFTVQPERPTPSCKAQTAFPKAFLTPKAFPTPKAHRSLSPRVGTEEGLLQEYLWFLRVAYRKA